jgi:hypothetical protein
MADDSDVGSPHRQRWARLRAAVGVGLNVLQVGVWYPVVDDPQTGEQLEQIAGRLWLDVDGIVWSIPEDGLEVNEEPDNRP